MTLGSGALSSAPLSSAVGGTVAFIGGASAELGISGVAVGATPVVFTGDASGAIAFAPSASGNHGYSAQLYNFLRFTSEATGSATICGESNTTLPFVGVAAGVGHVQGDAAAVVNIVVAVSAFSAVMGVASNTTSVFSTTATGLTSVEGTASQALRFSAASAGRVEPDALVSGLLTFVGSAAGHRGEAGEVSVNLPFSADIMAAHGRTGLSDGVAHFVGVGTGSIGNSGAVSAPVPIVASAAGSATLYPVGEMYAVLGIAAYASGLGQPEEVDACA